MNAGQILAVTLVVALASPPMRADEPAAKAAKTGALKLFILQGAGARNSIHDRTALQTVVEVRDEFNQPVRGAEVVFQLPADGPGGHFAGQQLGWTGKTDANGQVAATSFTPNAKTGPFNIQVSATHGPKVGYAVVSQTNSLAPINRESVTRRGKSGRWWKVAAVAGAAAAAGGIAWGVRRAGNRPDVVLQPGTISLGGPR